MSQPEEHAAMREAMLRSMKGLNATETTFYEDAVGFYHAVDWSERWIQALGAFHLVAWLLVFFTRRQNEMQMVLLIVILGLVYSAEWINKYAAARWDQFATQKYFDDRGVFVSVTFCAPLLLLAFCILINALRSAMTLLVEVKKLQFQTEARQKSKQAKAAATGSAPAAEGKKKQ